MTATVPSSDSVSTTTIDAAALRARLDGADGRPAPRLVDVRTAAEWETAHIDGAYHLPLDVVSDRAARLAERADDAELVIVCQSGARAEQAARALAGAGVSATVLQGGMNAWGQAGGDVVRGTERWALERQVRLVAGSIVLSGVLASTKVPAAKWAAGFVGGGLTFAALSNTCAMGNLLSRLPYNTKVSSPDVGATVDALAGGRPAPTA